MKKRYGYQDLVGIMARLRRPGGCPWDREQTHRSLIKYLREEAREVEHAIRTSDPDHLCEELGDLLLQIVFHADIARETGAFDMAEVVDVLCRKLIRRHPHVFGNVRMKNAAEVLARWDDIKRAEKAERAKDIKKKKRIQK